MRSDNFEDLKEGDIVLIEAAGYGSREFYMTKVLRRTKARIVTKKGEREQTWTNDGYSYPRPTGYGPRSNLVRATDEHIEMYKRHFAIRKIKNAHHALGRVLQYRDCLSKFKQADLDELAQVMTCYTDVDGEDAT